MKLSKFLPEVSARFARVAPAIPAHVRKVRDSGEYNDLYTRVAYDVFYSVYPMCERCDFYDKVAQEFPDVTDKHYATLFKAALAEVLPRD